jgi:hypothetical protein
LADRLVWENSAIGHIAGEVDMAESADSVVREGQDSGSEDHGARARGDGVGEAPPGAPGTELNG